MPERWNSPDPRIRPWTPIERAERDRIVGALADALTLPTDQVNYSRVAELLGITRPVLFSRLLHYQIPHPALVRSLTFSQRERIAEIRNVYRDDREQLGVAVFAFITEIWLRSSNSTAT